MLVFHTGFAEIPVPDLRRGRANADFGQGFYLSDDPAFAERWATEKKGAKTIINRYEKTGRMRQADLPVRRGQGRPAALYSMTKEGTGK